ncbi:MAG: TerC family protein [Elusimicrobia bacterium]|nr:TerC family protein [Elusimicrobiota bacterium]
MRWAAWGGFFAVILTCLALDLGVFNREAKAPTLRGALGWTAVWVAVSLAFAAAVFRGMGHRAGMDFLSGYLVEKSLSLDNIFVIAVIFQYFKVAPEHQHRLLFFGILGALVLRGLMIGVGAALLHRFAWMMYVFGLLLLWTAFKMARHGDEEVDPEHNSVLRLAKRWFPVTHETDGDRFTLLKNGRRYLTPLALALVVVETTDVVFAADSIPAIFGITKDAFIVFTSNVFAILGLRALYFALAWMLGRFRHMKPAVVTVLFFVAAKMLLSGLVKVPEEVSLGVIAGILGLGLAASLALPAETGA